VFDIIKLTREGTFPSGNFFSDSGLASYHDFDTLIPQSIKDEMDRITADLLSGSISSGTQSP
jgi:basic membrane protein A